MKVACSRTRQFWRLNSREYGWNTCTYLPWYVSIYIAKGKRQEHYLPCNEHDLNSHMRRTRNLWARGFEDGLSIKFLQLLSLLLFNKAGLILTLIAIGVRCYFEYVEEEKIAILIPERSRYDHGCIFVVRLLRNFFLYKQSPRNGTYWLAVLLCNWSAIE